ncbi:MAG: 3-deoxy-manno-octulosonate cytidylyltransferase [Hyphomicrobiaceae bacterium]
MTQAIVAIPARLQSTRLPNKPLADIHGEPMIVHVWRKAVAAEVGRVIVATDSEDIAAVVRTVGGEVVLTRAEHQSGSDRIFEAISKVDPDIHCDVLVNLQGDLPTVDVAVIRACVAGLRDRETDIVTAAAEIEDEAEKSSPNVVKIVGTRVGMVRPNSMRALYFTRATAPYGDGPLYHHIGIYAYRRSALERFVSLPRSPLEDREKLEQLRAIENGMRIDVAIVDTVPIGVDTQADLDRVRALLSPEA